MEYNSEFKVKIVEKIDYSKAKANLGKLIALCVKIHNLRIKERSEDGLPRAKNASKYKSRKKREKKRIKYLIYPAEFNNVSVSVTMNQIECVSNSVSLYVKLELTDR